MSCLHYVKLYLEGCFIFGLSGKPLGNIYYYFQVDLEQPVFGSNYINGKVTAQPDGGWSGEAKFNLYFKSGGAIEYGQALLQAAKLGRSKHSL